jgi:hypothetical protein
LAVISLYYLPSISIDNDIRYYTKVVESLVIYGIENGYHHYNSLEQFSTTTTPNHYFEFWIGSLFLKINYWQESLIIFKYGVYFALRYWALLGMLAIVEFLVKKVSLWHVVYVAFFSLITWNLPLGFLGNNGWDTAMYSSIWMRPNMIIYYSYLMATVLLFFYKESTMGLRVLMLLPIASIVTAPAIFSSIFLFSLYKWLFLGQKKYSKLVFEVVSVALFIAVFYLIHTDFSSNNIAGLEQEDFLSKTLSLIKPILFFIVNLTFRCGVFLIIALVLIQIFNDEEQVSNKYLQDIALLCSLLVVTGVFLFQVIAYVDNSYQLAYISYVSVVAFVFLSSIFVLFGKTKPARSKLQKPIAIFASITLISLIVWSLYKEKKHMSFDFSQPDLAMRDLKHYGFSEEYIEDVSEFLKGRKNVQGAFAVSPGFLGKYASKRRHTLTYQIDSHVAYFISGQSSHSVIYPDVMYMEETEDSKEDFAKAHSFNDRLTFYSEYQN